MTRQPQRLADLLPQVVADLTARHLLTNGAPPPMTAPRETIWRFPLPLEDAPTVEVPRYARVLSVGPPRPSTGVDLDLWVLVDPTVAVEPRGFRVVGTGNPMPDDCGRYIGTTHSHGGALIWHVFEAAVQAA